MDRTDVKDVKDVTNVTNAAEWLDKQHPGWERKIDLGKLDINDCRDCILGQALADLAVGSFVTGYDVGMKELWWGEKSVKYIPWKGAFIHPRYEPIWAALIKERFASGTLSDED